MSTLPATPPLSGRMLDSEDLALPLSLDDLSTSSPAPLPLTLDANIEQSTNASQELIREWFRMYPDLMNLRVHPVTRSGNDERYVLGLHGYVYLASNGHRVHPVIDWNATRERLIDAANEHIQVTVTDTIDRIHNWYWRRPEWASLKVRPITRDGHESTRYYLGNGVVLYYLQTNRRTIEYNYDSLEAVDWRAMEERI